MAVDDDIDSLEQELEGLDDDDGGGRRAVIMRFLPVILAVGALVVLSIVVLISYSGDGEEEQIVMNIQEIAPGTATIKIEPDGGAPVAIEGQENPAYNPMNQGTDEPQVATITPPPEEPKKPETGGVIKIPPPDAPPEEVKNAPIIVPPPGEEGAAAEGKGEPKPENLMANPETPMVDPAVTQGDAKLPETAGTQETMKPETKAGAAQAGGADQPALASKILKPPPKTGMSTTEFRTMDGVYRVQVASAKSEGLAQREWTAQVTRYPDVLSKLSLTVQRAVVKDRGTFYRVQGGPFPDRNAADSVCRKLKSRGQDCLVVRP